MWRFLSQLPPLARNGSVLTMPQGLSYNPAALTHSRMDFTARGGAKAYHDLYYVLPRPPPRKVCAIKYAISQATNNGWLSRMQSVINIVSSSIHDEVVDSAGVIFVFILFIATRVCHILFLRGAPSPILPHCSSYLHFPGLPPSAHAPSSGVIKCSSIIVYGASGGLHPC